MLVSNKHIAKIGIQSIDEEHQHLIDSLNYMSYNKECKTYAQYLVQMVKIADEVFVHFNHEEQVMKSIGYPGLLEHQKEHNELLASIEKLLVQPLSGTIIDPLSFHLQIISSLHNSIVNHVNTSDIKIGIFLEHKNNPK